MTLLKSAAIVTCVVLAGQNLRAHDPHDPIGTTAASPNFAQDQTVFAATQALSIKINVYALLKSTDGGVTWLVVKGLPNSPIQSIVFSPAYSQDQTIFVAGQGGLYRSANQGTSWTPLTKQSLQSMAISPNFANDGRLFVVTTNAMILGSTNRGQTLTSLSVPAPLTSGLTVIAVSPNYSTDNTLLLGSDADGIFESSNGGAAWAPVTSGLTVPIVTMLTFSPAFSSDRVAFAGTYGAGVLMTGDGGSSWSFSNSGISDLNVTSIALSPTYLVDSTLWVTTAVAGVFQSTDLGGSWSLEPIISRMLSNLTTTHYLAMTPAVSGGSTTLYLATYEGFWSSSATAISWQYIDLIPTRLIRGVNLSPNYANDQTVFANTYGGGNLWSTSAGGNWTFQNTGMQNAYTDVAAFSPNYANDGIAFSSNSNGLQKTSNRGASWQLMHGVGVANHPRGLAISPAFAQDSTVLIGVDNTPGLSYPMTFTYQGQTYFNQGIFLSTDGGNDWIPTGLNGPPIIGVSVSPAFASDRTAFAVGSAFGIYKSTDGGMTWALLSLPAALEHPALLTLSPSFATDNVIFAAGFGGSIYKSTNRGTSWSLLPLTSSLRAIDIQLSPNYLVDQTLFVSTVQGGLMVSTNGGNSLVPISSFPDNFLTSVAFSPNYANDHTVFAAAYHGLFKSASSGSAWTYTMEPARIEESRSTSTLVGQPPPSITYSGMWSFLVPEQRASTNAFMSTSESQDTAVFQFTGTGFRWVTLKGPGQGSASMQLDGVPIGTVSLSGAVNQYQQKAWEQQGLSCGAHTLVITALPQSGQAVSVDAFDIWIDTCPIP